MEEEAGVKTSVEAYTSSPDPVRDGGEEEGADQSSRANGGVASTPAPLASASPPQPPLLRTSYGGSKKAEAAGRFALKRGNTQAWGSAADGHTLRGEVDQVALLLQGASAAAKRGPAGGGGGGDSGEVAEMVSEMRKEVAEAMAITRKEVGGKVEAVNGRVDELGKKLDVVQSSLNEVLKRLSPPTNI